METTCWICKNTINKNDGNHLNNCSRKNNIKLPKDEVKYKHICFNANFSFTKKYMSKKYLELSWSLPDFKKEHNLQYNQTLFLLKYFNITARTIKEANKNDKRKEKYKKTCLEKYGKENVSQVDEVKDKKSNIFMENYGVSNIWKDPKYLEWLHDFMFKTYGKKSLSNRYGNLNKFYATLSKEERQRRTIPARTGYKKWYDNLSDEQKQIFIEKKSKSLRKNVNFDSLLETRICSILSEIKIDFKHQHWVKQKSYDFKISNTYLLLEINGDFWHANPEIYNKNDIVNFPDGPRLASDIWEKDLKKKQLAESYGYDVIYLWEKDLRRMTDVEVIAWILQQLEYYDENRKNKKNNKITK